MEKYTFRVIVFVWMLIFAVAAQATNIKVDPATVDSPSVGETLAISVKIEDVSGLFGYGFDLAFDNTAIKFSSIESGEFLGSDGVDTLTFLNIDERQVYFSLTPEMLAILLASGEDLETEITPEVAAEVTSAGVLSVIGTRLGTIVNVDGGGTLVVITFEVIAVKDSALELQNVELGSATPDSDAQIIPTDVENGAITLPGIKGDVSGDGVVRSNDALLALQIVVGLITPTEQQRWAADMDGDGAIRANDAGLILVAAVSSAAPGKNVIASTGGNATVTLSEAHGVAGETIAVSIKVDNADILGSGSISIAYDSSVLRAIEVSSGSDMLLVSNLVEPGMVRIAFASADKLSSKILARIRFDVLSDGTSPLAFSTIDLYTPGAQPVTSRGVDKRFTSWAMPPERSALMQNFPNPFNPETWIPYQLKDANDVTVRIYNLGGELVRELDLGHKSAGLYVSRDRSAYWDGRNKYGTEVASGVYFYSIRAGDFAALRKLIILK